VAREFGVSEEQIRVDLDLLFVCGLPGYGPGDLIDVVFDGDRVALSNADTISQPLRLSHEEAVALVAALRALVGVPGIVDTGAVDRALAKLEAAVGEGAEPGEVAVAAEPTAAPEVGSAVSQALRERRRLHLQYWVPARDEATSRDVDPIRMFSDEGAAYLVGWCRRVEDVRTFRLDRVLEVTVLTVPAEVPAEALTRALDAGLFSPAVDDMLVTVSLDPSARWVAEYFPCERVDERGDGGLVVQLRARDRAWVTWFALGLAGSARILEPADVVEQVRGAAAAALSGYGAG
jgi:proteasome accessory factor C